MLAAEFEPSQATSSDTTAQTGDFNQQPKPRAGSDDGSNSPEEVTQTSTKSAQPSGDVENATPQQRGSGGGAFRFSGGIDPTLLAHASANLQNQQFLAPNYVGSHLQGTYLVSSRLFPSRAFLSTEKEKTAVSGAHIQDTYLVGCCQFPHPAFLSNEKGKSSVVRSNT